MHYDGAGTVLYVPMWAHWHRCAYRSKDVLGPGLIAVIHLRWVADADGNVEHIQRVGHP